MNRRNFSQAAGMAVLARATLAAKAKPPNLLVIHTDEHNFRTLGCYREQLSEDQAFVWGAGVKVDTPHIDSLARDGAICTSYYASSPVCTPSRASFVSGLYPVATGSHNNDLPMHDHIVTFAEILKRNGYATAYLGKWHLDGDAKPGFAPARKFGFDDNRYMFNRGHWKMLQKTPSGAELIGKTENYSNKKIGEEEAESFTTDFLTDRALEIIARDQAKPFCLMLSIPDPHGPNTVRAPYDTMFNELVFQHPRTMMVDAATMPKWVQLGGKNEADEFKQQQMQWYFGMVKCIDDNVGKILQFLKDQRLEENTIVVFTSDHGDLMGEHKKHNKGLPYETSAGIPFVIRYPGRIRPGKFVDTAYTTADFAPTILGLMGFGGQLAGCHGLDDSAAFLGGEPVVRDDRIVYITNAGGRWTAAANHRYKLVLSPVDDPWLFDLERDPDELVNFFNDPEYQPVAERFKAELVAQMARYGEPALKAGNLAQETGGGKPAPALASSPGYLVDSGNHSVKGKAGDWNRAFTVPAGSFEPDSAYEMELEWESQGLADDTDFFANFIGPAKDRKLRQLETWKGAAGETGTVRKVFKTDGSNQWVLHVGVKGEGHLVVKRIRIKKKASA